MYQRILFPTDGSDITAKALKQALSHGQTDRRAELCTRWP